RKARHETSDDSQRPKPQSAWRARAAYLRHHDACADQGGLRARGSEARSDDFVPPVQSRGRTRRPDPVGAAKCRRYHHQPSRLFLYLDRDGRRHQGVRWPGHRGARFQHPRPRRTSPALEDLARRDRRHLRAWPPWLYRRDAGAHRDADEVMIESVYGVTGDPLGRAMPFEAATWRRRSGRSEMIPSTPNSIMRAMSAGLFTVQTTTLRPSAWCAETSAGGPSPK